MRHQRAKIKRWIFFSLDHFRKGKEKDEVVKEKKVVGEKKIHFYEKFNNIFCLVVYIVILFPASPQNL